MRIIIKGHIPGKKNLYLRSKNGRMFKNASLQAEIDAITRQILMQTGNIQPLVHPTIRAHFVCSDARSDIDNKWTTVQDCLVAAQVIENDNLNHLSGPITISGTVERGTEFTTIEIEETKP